MRIKYLLLFCAVAVAFSSTLQAESFGIKFLGNSDTTVSSLAGVTAMSGWTNISTSTFVSGTIFSSDGSVSATLTRSGLGAHNLWHSGSAGDGGNGSLLDGYNDSQANSPSTSVISGLTGSSYTVYIYVAGDAPRPSDNQDMLPNYTVNGTVYYTAAIGGNGAFLGLIKASTTAANNNTYPSALAYGNYIEIDNVVPVAGAITISANEDNRTWRSPLNGIEIVAATPAPLIQMPPASQTIYTNGLAQFSVPVKGVSPLSFNWSKNGVPLTNGLNISGAQTSVLTVSNLTFADIGAYAVTVTNAFGSITSPAANLSVVAPTLADWQIDAFNNAYLVQTNGLTYYTKSLTNRAYDGGWTFALDIQGEEDAYERTLSPQHRLLVNNLCTTFLLDNPPGDWSNDPWNDDIGWMSLVLIRGYQMTGNANFLAQAEFGFNMAFARGWDTNFNGGGIWEQQPSADPTAGKNPLACDSLLQTVCMIYQSTSNATYLAKAQLIYGWVRTNLFVNGTGLICGNIATNGVVDTTPNLYNQGTFLDCANLLYQITGRQNYFDDGLKAVEFTRNNLTDNGIFNNNATWLNTWAAEFARALSHFVKLNNLWSTYYPWMQANANAAWACRRPDYDVSWNAWTQPTPTTNDIIANWAVNTVAMTQATPAPEPGLVNCTNQVSGAVIGTGGSWNNGGNTIAKVFDGNLNTFFDGPDGSGDWVGLDFGGGISNVIGQINYWPRGGYSQRMTGGIFQGASNASFAGAVTLFTIETAPPEGGVVTSQTITNRTAFRFVRYVGPPNASCNVAELQFFAPHPLPAPLYVTNRWNGSQLVLSWPGAGLLLEATNLAGPWTTNSTASSPLDVAPNAQQKFYRVQFQ
jgi:hypothetical protein